MATHFISFANTDYMLMDKIHKHAQSFNLFDTINLYNEGDIAELIERHPHFFALYKKRGFGLWMWKPYIILKKLLTLNNGEILFYIDAGSVLNVHGKSRFEEYLDLLLDEENKVVAFQTSNYYKGFYYVKADCVQSYFPNYYTYNLTCYYAGALLIKNSDFTRKLIKEWLGLCENENFIDSSPSKTYAEHEEFIGQDADNGLLNLVLGKFLVKYSMFGKIISIFPDEVSLCNSEGVQLVHSLDYSEFLQQDWSQHSSFPIQFRRWRP